MKIIKSLKGLAVAVCIAVALAFTSSSAVAQTTNNQQFTYIPLPFTTLQSTSAELVTNLNIGWQTYVTNTSINSFWSNSIAAVVTVTNTTYGTNTLYADFSSEGQTAVPIHWEFNCSAGASNVIYWVSRSTSGINYPTNLVDPAVTPVTNVAMGVTYKIGENLIDMSGYNFGRVIMIKWDTVNAGDILTNRMFVKGNKRNLFRP